MSNTKDLERLRDRFRTAKNKIKGVVDGELSSSAVKVQQMMQQYAPVDTGFLRAHIAIVKSPGRYQIGPVGVSYAAAQEYGAKPHIIIASPGHVLVFSYKGKTTYATKVHHPGNKPHPYVRPAQEWAAANLPVTIGVSAAKLLVP